MKLRNKKTGEIIESACIGVFKHKSSGDCERVDTEARSLEKFFEVWEDYAPKEPLIKDEKIRKAVRAWADINNIIEVCYDAVWNAFRMDDFVCSFDYDFDRYDGLVDGCHYTIAQLCGEEE